MNLSLKTAGVLVMLGGLGCTETVDAVGETDAWDTNATDENSSGETGGGPEDDDDDDGPAAADCEPGASNVAGPRLLRRLTTDELSASVRAVFGLDEVAWSGPALPPDPAAGSGYTNDADRLRVTEAFAVALETTAQEIATAVRDPARLATLLPCATAGGVDCARTFITTQGAALYRRPLTDEEIGRYLDLYDEVAADEGFDGFVYWATVTLLQSPHFIYRSELGEPDAEGGYTLSPYEVATAVAYTFGGTPPDEALLQLAAAGGLQSSQDVLDAVRAFALDADGKPLPQLRDRLHVFHRQWLGLSGLANAEKDPTLYPGFDGAVKAGMQAELDAFVEQVLFEDGGGASELLTADHSELDAALASYYGFGQAGTASPKPETWGTGVLSLGGVLASHSTYLATSPTQRGFMVRGKFLCTTPPPPPPGVGDLPEPGTTDTTRERYEMHVSSPSCAGCHVLMDPIGFGFESLDASGRYRSDENGFPIDDSGTVVGLGTTEDIPFVGPVELAEALAAAPVVSECVTAQMASFAFGMSTESTECIVDGPAEQMANGEIGMVEAFVAFAGTEHFLHRR